MPDLPEEEKSRTYKALTIFAIGAGVGFGTCGLGFLAAQGRPSNSLLPYIMAGGAIVFFVSLAGLVIIALIALWTAISSEFKK